MSEEEKSEAVGFQQPFLCLFTDSSKEIGSEGYLYIDVGGNIDLYIEHEYVPTDFLLELCSLFEKEGYSIKGFGSYVGSAGPTHIFKRGILFSRWCDKNGKNRELPKVIQPRFYEHW